MKQFKQGLILLSIMFLGLLFTGCSATPFELEAETEITSELIPSPNNFTVTAKTDFSSDPNPGFTISFTMPLQANKVSHYKLATRETGTSNDFVAFTDNITESTTGVSSNKTITVNNPSLNLGFSSYDFIVYAISSDGNLRGPSSDIVSANLRAFKDKEDTIGTDGVIGSFGTGNGQFSRPTDIAVDSDGNSYVFDSGNNRIQKFDNTGTHQNNLGGFDSPNGGICINSNNNLAVANSNQDTVAILNSSLVPIEILSSGTTGLNTLFNPINCAFDSNNVLAISGLDRNEIFISTDATLTNFNSVGSFGDAALEFKGPIDIDDFSIGGINGFAVLDKGNNRVMFIDSSDRSHKGTISLSNDINQAENFSIINTTLNGANISLMYIADTRQNSIKVYSLAESGGLISTASKVAQWGTLGADFGEFNNPKGIHVLANGTVFIVDSNNNRIQVFKD